MLFSMASAKGATYYTILCFILWLALSHPKYMAASKIIKAKSQSQLVELLGLSQEQELYRITKDKRNKKAKKDLTSVESTMLIFTANWADQCYFTYPLWVKWANRFTT